MLAVSWFVALCFPSAEQRGRTLPEPSPARNSGRSGMFRVNEIATQFD
jgi:hypothetical protein